MADIFCLIFLTGIAIDFARRIIAYARTKDYGYKHEHFYYSGKNYKGKHRR